MLECTTGFVATYRKLITVGENASTSHDFILPSSLVYRFFYTGLRSNLCWQ